MADDSQVERLEAELRRFKRLVTGSGVVLVCLLGLGAAALKKDEAIRGKLSILDDNGEPRTVLHPSGDVEIGGQLKINERLILKDKDVGGQLSELATLRSDLKSLRKALEDEAKACCIKYQVHEVVYNVNTKFPQSPTISTFSYGPWGSKVIAVWWEPIDAIAGIDNINRVWATPDGNRIKVELSKPRPGGAFIRIRYHILFAP